MDQAIGFERRCLATYGLSTYTRTWTWQARPKGVRLRTARACFANAGRLAQAGRGTYIEGYCGPVHHAWVVDTEGRVIETTPGWQAYRAEYVGVPIRSSFVAEGLAANGEWWTLLHHITRAVRDGRAAERMVDVGLLARFDASAGGCRHAA